jgi:hypothetical protein
LKDEIQIAALVPIGPLNRMGYQYYWKDIIENHANVFDKVYVCTNLYENIDLKFDYDNVELVYHKDLLLEKNSTGKEEYSQIKVKQAVEAGVEKIRKDGLDFVVMIMINSYLDDENAVKMRKYLKRLKKEKKPFGVYTNAFQIYDKVFYPREIMPYILNLKSLEKKEFSTDKIIIDNVEYPWIGGSLFENTSFTIIDIDGEQTEGDYKEKYNWYHKSLSREMEGKEIGKFNFSERIKNLENRMLTIVVNKDYQLSELGYKIKNSYPENSIFRLTKMKYSNYYIQKIKNIYRKFRFKKYRKLLNLYKGI